MAGSGAHTRSTSGLWRLQGVAVDVVLIALAASVAQSLLSDWLAEHPAGLYYGLSALHLVTLPALLSAIIFGWGRAGSKQELQRSGSGLLGWSVALFIGCSFIVPGVLGLLLRTKLWVMMATIFGPLALLVLAIWAVLWAEKRKLLVPRPVGQPPPPAGVQALAVLTWAYLAWTETMLLVAAGKQGPLVTVGLPLGVLLGYLPVRALLYYVRDGNRWEKVTIPLSVLHLLFWLAAAGR